MKNNIHQEFIFQSRELGAQIEDTLGDPPDKKNYARVIASLLGEFSKGTAIDDVNLLSFALVDYLSFDDPAGLLTQSRQYDGGDAAKAIKMVSCKDAVASKALAKVSDEDPDLARKAIITAFLFKNAKRWDTEDDSLDALKEEEDLEENIQEGSDDEHVAPGQEFMDIFDTREDENG